MTVPVTTNPNMMVVQIPTNGHSDDAILESIRNNRKLAHLQSVSPMDDDNELSICPNLERVIACIIVLGHSHIAPYYSETARNKALVAPFMLLLHIAVFCLRDLIFHTYEFFYYLITLKIDAILLPFINMLCDIVAIILHAIVTLPLACTAIILRHLITAVIGYYEAAEKQPVISGSWFDTYVRDHGVGYKNPVATIAKTVDQSLDDLIYNTSQHIGFFKHFTHDKAEVSKVIASHAIAIAIN